MVNCNQTPEMLKTNAMIPGEYGGSPGSLISPEMWYPAIKRDSDQSLLNRMKGWICEQNRIFN